MHEETREILRNAREYISQPGSWCKDVLAKNAEGVAVNTYDDDACVFCAMGAVLRACYDKAGLGEVCPKRESLLERARIELQAAVRVATRGYASQVELYNDKVGQSRLGVVKLFNIALGDA